MVTVFIIVFYVYSKNTLLAFSFLLLSCREKDYFVMNGFQIYVLIMIIIMMIIIIIIMIIIIKFQNSYFYITPLDD